MVSAFDAKLAIKSMAKFKLYESNKNKILKDIIHTALENSLKLIIKKVISLKTIVKPLIYIY